MACLLARDTSREAEATARQLGVLPYCRSSFERMGHVVGALYGQAAAPGRRRWPRAWKSPKARTA